MYNRRLISYVAFVIGVLLILAGLLAIGGIQAGTGILAGLAAIIIGIFFYRRSAQEVGR